MIVHFSGSSMAALSMDNNGILAAIVAILAPTGAATGAGFVISPDGKLATCVHVLDLAKATSDGTVYPFGATSYQAGRSAVEAKRKRYRYTGKGARRGVSAVT